MKRTYFLLSLLLFSALACNFGAAAPVVTTESPADVPTVDSVVTVEEPTLPSADPQPQLLPGTAYTCANLTITIPEGLAVQVDCQQFPPASGDQVAPWDVTPGHTEIGLDGYALPEKFHRPRIYVFPVLGLVALQPYVAENITSLQNIQASEPGTLLTRQDLPGIHFFNAGAVFAANITPINFQNGSGVRSLAVFGQYFAPVNNNELFYHFQGLTDNGQYYIIAILPITHPSLQADSTEGSLPADAAFPVYPGFSSDNFESSMDTYYQSMGDLLDFAAPDIFYPTLTSLDSLIASIEILP